MGRSIRVTGVVIWVFVPVWPVLVREEGTNLMGVCGRGCRKNVTLATMVRLDGDTAEYGLIK